MHLQATCSKGCKGIPRCIHPVFVARLPNFWSTHSVPRCLHRRSDHRSFVPSCLPPRFLTCTSIWSFMFCLKFLKGTSLTDGFTNSAFAKRRETGNLWHHCTDMHKLAQVKCRGLWFFMMKCLQSLFWSHAPTKFAFKSIRPPDNLCSSLNLCTGPTRAECMTNVEKCWKHTTQLNTTISRQQLS